MNERPKALLIIDMLNDFVSEGGALDCGPSARGIIDEISRLAAEFRRRGSPVIHVCDRHHPDDAEFTQFPPHALAGSWGAEICPELQPAPEDQVLAKRRFSAFYATGLDLLLREKGIGELVLCGVCTNICVLYTAADARMRGYDVVVPARAVASFDQTGHEFALRELKQTLKARVE